MPHFGKAENLAVPGVLGRAAPRQLVDSVAAVSG